MNPSVFILALLAFVVGTAELVIAGILDGISRDFQISPGAAGLLMSVYALVYALGAPVLISLTSHIERRKLLITSLAVFAGANLLSAMSGSFLLLMASRIIVAASCSIIVVLAITLAAAIVTEDQRGQAIGMIFSGIVASLVLGVPLGTLVGVQWGWRMTFFLLTAVTVLVIPVVRSKLRQLPGAPPAPLRKKMATTLDKESVFAHLASLLQMTGQFTIFTYISPFLAQTMDLGPVAISMVLLVYGVGGIFGAWLGGWSTDKLGAQRTFLTFLPLHAIAVLAMPASTISLTSLLALVMLWCVFNMAPGPAIQKYLFERAPSSASVQLGINTSAIQLGVAFGSFIGAQVMDHFSPRTNAYVGGVVILLAMLSGLASSRLRQSRMSGVAVAATTVLTADTLPEK